jgi:prevent-host-death family protein
MVIDYDIYFYVEIETIAISEFKATCLAVLERVRRTGLPVLVTRHGVPIAQIIPPAPSAAAGAWLGSLANSVQFIGDVVSPAVEPDEWEANR